MVEGGASVIGTFMSQASQPCYPGESPVVDTLIITVAPTLVGSDGMGYTVGNSGDKQSVGAHSVCSECSPTLLQIPRFTHVRTELMGRDVVIAGKLM